MITAHKIALQPTPEQENYFFRAAGTARFAYNWALVNWQEFYKKGEKPNEQKMRKLLNSIKKEQFPWMTKVSKIVVQQSIKNLGNAYVRFFKKIAKYPKLKKKNKCKDSFRVDNGTSKTKTNAVQLNKNMVKIPKLGWVKMREELRFKNCKILSATVSRTANRWFISFVVEIEDKPIIRENQAVVGIDLGLKTFATLSSSNGKIIAKIDAPKPLKANLKKLRRLSKSHSRKQKGSNNKKKSAKALSVLHARIADVRNDFIHKLTKWLIDKYGVIGIETLSVKAMAKLWGKAISDLGLYEFRRQLEYKWKRNDNLIVEADKWFASSKGCSSCDWKNKDLKLSDRQWTCQNCGEIHDRDANASINLENLAAGIAVSFCGATGSGIFHHEISETSCGEARNLVVEISP